MLCLKSLQIPYFSNISFTISMPFCKTNYFHFNVFIISLSYINIHYIVEYLFNFIHFDVSVFIILQKILGSSYRYKLLPNILSLISCDIFILSSASLLAFSLPPL